MFLTLGASGILTGHMENVSEAPELKLQDDATPFLPPQHGTRERWRKPFSVVAILAVVAMIPLVPATQAGTWHELESVTGLALVALAVLGRLWCATYIAGRKNTELCRVGPYSLVRHPLYVFSSLGLLGVLITTHRPFLAAVGLALFWVYYSYVMQEEDDRLKQVFGGEFTAYCHDVSSVWPDFRRFRDVHTLSVATAPLRRTFADVLWFFAALILVKLACE